MTEGHQHLRHQPCNTTCEPDPGLRCGCGGDFLDLVPDQCHLRATAEDLRCESCRERCGGGAPCGRSCTHSPSGLLIVEDRCPVHDQRASTTSVTTCPHGDPYCPCQDPPDPCHYEGVDPMECWSPDCTVTRPHPKGPPPSRHYLHVR